MDFVEFCPCASSKPCHKAVEPRLVMPVKRIGLVLFCAAWGAVAANYSSGNNQCRLLTKCWTAQNFLIQKWQDRPTCAKSKKLSRTYISMYKSCRICTSMDITTNIIAAVMGKGLDENWSVRLWVKIHLHRWPAVAWTPSVVCAKYCGRPQQHWHHDTCGMAVVSLKCAAALKQLPALVSFSCLPVYLGLWFKWFKYPYHTLFLYFQTLWHRFLFRMSSFQGPKYFALQGFDCITFQLEVTGYESSCAYLVWHARTTMMVEITIIQYMLTQ